MTVKRVVNHSGPQTLDGHRDAVCQHMPQTVKAGSVSHTAEYPFHTAINERLSSMEAHIKLSAGKCNYGVLNFHTELAVSMSTSFTFRDR